MVGKTVVARGGWWWWAAANPMVRLEMSGNEEKIDSSNYHVREMCVAES
jgi:hypothetical protein